ncbi:MAG TPA: 3-methyl-2-oxobutanoate hydroxymethyltransferase [Steroidobacteraceae bacterium]|jgi:3-methyl-2-oxobutanoate hydroxymethyltransferase|nr:3-methyl-2-oxobutanoate hydroxymethyltransferase [Steroidobacteraceae bacterium]
MTQRKPLTLHRLREMHSNGEKIAMLTCYDATFARVLDDAAVDALLIGDSLGTVLQGRATTLPVSIDEIAYHTACVARGNRTAWMIADLPFGSYQESTELAVRHAVRLMQAGAHMIKLEGGGWTTAIVRSLVDRGIPVCAHLGFTPQSVNALGYRVQGRDETAAVLHRHAEELAAAGASLLVLEMVPAQVARHLTQHLSIATIGIGAGVGCSGQVLVLHDMLGLTPGEPYRFVRNFMDGAGSIDAAVRQFVAEVKAGRFPDDKIHSF